jgi:transposase
VAARCRKASRTAKRAARQALGTEEPLEAAPIPPEEAGLTDEQWELVRPLLPPRRDGIGRPPLDHRAVLDGMLWVARTGSSWREMPEEFGKWETAYRRHELWVKQGLWQRILRALGEQAQPGPTMKEPK